MNDNKDLIIETARTQIYELTVKLQQIQDQQNNIAINESIRIINLFLPIIDGFELANRAVGKDCKDNNIIGFQLIYKQFMKILDSLNIQTIQTESFNNHEHEVIEVIKDAKANKNDILEVVYQGYTINNHIIRQAKIKIAE